MIQNLISGIPFLKILFWAYNFIIFVHTFHWTSSEFFSNFRFSSRKSQSQQKLEERSLILQYSFAQKTSLILRTSTHLTSKIICSRNTTKYLSFNLVSEKTFALSHFLTGKSAFLKHFESKCLYISAYLRKKMFVPET